MNLSDTNRKMMEKLFDRSMIAMSRVDFEAWIDGMRKRRLEIGLDKEVEAKE